MEDPRCEPLIVPLNGVGCLQRSRNWGLERWWRCVLCAWGRQRRRGLCRSRATRGKGQRAYRTKVVGRSGLERSVQWVVRYAPWFIDESSDEHSDHLIASYPFTSFDRASSDNPRTNEYLLTGPELKGQHSDFGQLNGKGYGTLIREAQRSWKQLRVKLCNSDRCIDTSHSDHNYRHRVVGQKFWL